MKNEPIIPPDRLLDAADAVLLGLAEAGLSHAGRLPSSILGTLEQPAAFCEYTRAEIIAAEQFLIRSGLWSVSEFGPGSFRDQTGAA